MGDFEGVVGGEGLAHLGGTPTAQQAGGGTETQAARVVSEVVSAQYRRLVPFQQVGFERGRVDHPAQGQLVAVVLEVGVHVKSTSGARCGGPRPNGDPVHGLGDRPLHVGRRGSMDDELDGSVSAYSTASTGGRAVDRTSLADRTEGPCLPLRETGEPIRQPPKPDSCSAVVIMVLSGANSAGLIAARSADITSR